MGILYIKIISLCFWEKIWHMDILDIKITIYVLLENVTGAFYLRKRTIYLFMGKSLSLGYSTHKFTLRVYGYIDIFYIKFLYREVQQCCFDFTGCRADWNPSGEEIPTSLWGRCQPSILRNLGSYWFEAVISIHKSNNCGSTTHQP